MPLTETVPTYDPTLSFFQAQASRPSRLENVALADLPPVLRMLLVKDGTVTSAIAAYYLEDIATSQVDQSATTLTAQDPWLKLPVGAQVIRRRVTLQSGDGETLFVYAESLLAATRLPPDMRKALAAPDSNLGRILREDRSETLREGLWFGRERLVDLPAAVARICDGDFLSRTYRVVARGAPLMIVTERFPLRTFAG